MRSKLAQHGAGIFDTYELLEMLLYYTVVQKDTNPVAKRILTQYGSLGALLSTDEERLVEGGLSSSSAGIISLVGSLDGYCAATAGIPSPNTFDDYVATGEATVDYFTANPDATAVMFLLDNSMRLLDVRGIDTPRFGSAGTKPRLFIDAVIRSGATVAVLAFCNKNGLLHPFDSDVATIKMVESELLGVGVSLVETYIVAGSRFAHAGPKSTVRCSASRAMRRFNHTRMLFEGELLQGEEIEERISAPKGTPPPAATLEFLQRLLSYSSADKADEQAELLASRYGSLDTVLSLSRDILVRAVGESSANIIKLACAVSARGEMDRFIFGRPHTGAEIAKFLCAYLYGSPVETVSMLSLDSRGRVLGVDTVGVGTVNASDIYARRILECAMRREADHVIIAHNHPFGSAEPSEEDVAATATLYTTCRRAGIILEKHVIVSGRDHFVLGIDNDLGTVVRVGKSV